MDAFHAGAHGVIQNKAIAVQLGVGGHSGIGETGGLLQAAEDVQTEAVNAHIQPELEHLVDLLPQGLIIPVQVGHFLGILMQIVFAGQLVILPCGAIALAETVAPVVRLRAVSLGRLPYVVVTVGVVLGFAGFLEPNALVGGVVQHLIHNDPDAHAVSLVQQHLEILQGAVIGVDIVIVGHIVAIIHHRGFVDGGKPDTIHTQLLQLGKLGHNALQITDAIAVAVAKTLAVDLVDNRFLPPFFLHNVPPPMLFAFGNELPLYAHTL